MGQWFAAATVAVSCVGAVQAGDNVGKPRVPPGEHPRVLFTRNEIGRIHQLARTPAGKKCIAKLRFLLESHDSGELIKHLTAGDPAWRKKVCKAGRSGQRSLGQLCLAAALVYQATGDQRDGLLAAEAVRLTLEAYPDVPRPVESWGNWELALAYDMLYNDLDEATRTRFRRVLASMIGPPTRRMFDTKWWLGLGHANGRTTTNWTPICAATLGLTALAIEGEEGWNPEVFRLSVQYMRAFLTHGVTADGALYEGIGYGMSMLGGIERGPVPFVEAMHRRGVDLAATTHWWRAPEWMAYEILPWGYQAQGLNQTMGRFAVTSPLVTYLACRGAPWSSWLWRSFNLPGADPGQPDPLLGLTLGQPRWNGERPDKLPLSRWFSVRGQVFSRSGWGERDAAFVFNTNPLGSGHSHADNGSFCLASNGANFIADEGTMYFASDYHNVVHIDGKAQSSGGQANLEAYIRAVETSALADLVDADLKRAYDLTLDGDTATGVRWWCEYNPVEKADRRAIFVRGASGTLVVIADDLRKDGHVHEYDWLARTEKHNVLSVSGRTFRIAERFGGRCLRSMTEGARTTLVARKVPGGVYRAWALVRGEPAPSGWSTNTFTVNGRLAPYDTSFFGREFHTGWHWNPILPDKKPDITIPEGGEIKVLVRCYSGGRVALAVFTRNPKWAPGDTIPATGGDFQVLTVAGAQPGKIPWEIIDSPKGVLDGVFLGSKPPTLSIARTQNTNRRVLHAKRKAVDGRFLAVLVPRDENDGRSVALLDGADGRAARIAGPAGTDLVAGAAGGAPTRGQVVTDGAAAVVSLGSPPAGVKDAPLRGYVLAAGTHLAYRGRALVQAEGKALHVLNDGRRLVVRGPGGASVTCLRLGATALVVNGSATTFAPKPTVVVRIPQLPKTWTIAVAKDGRRVVVTGDGPQPLSIRGAPDAVEVIVNGVSRYFVKDKAGVLYPTLEAGTTIYPVQNRISAPNLRAHLRPGIHAKLVGNALRTSEEIALGVPTAGPGVYRIVLGCRVARDGEVAVTIDGKSAGPASRLAAGKDSRLTFDKVTLRAATLRLCAKAAGGLDVLFLDLHPQRRPIRSEHWSVIGPVDNPQDTGGWDAKDVRRALERTDPPQQKIDVAATVRSADGRNLRWRDGTKIPGVHINFSKLLGFPSNRVCLAVTYITSPEPRAATLGISPDAWANAWLNGRKLTSNRAAVRPAEDGAQFVYPSFYCAPMRLKRGVNVLLVKCRGGGGTNSFRASITDPGDLRFSARP